MTTGTTTPLRATRREWAGLALLVLPMLTLSTDLTVLFLALPTLSEALDPSASQALWIVHVYGFLIAGFLVTMGRLGDRIGPRRLLLIGGTAFGLLSLLAAYSPNPEMLIAARALLGIAGATLMPSLFSLLRTMFRDDAQRRLAIAIMFSAFSAGGALGPLLGGALLEHFWWGSVFLINIPPMVLLAVAGPRLLPERTERRRTALDLPSVALSVAGMLAIVYGLQELAAGQETGDGVLWPNVLVTGLGLLALIVFVLRQRRLRDPLLDLALLTNPRIAVSLVALLLVGIGVVGTFYLVTQHLQWVAGQSPLQAGLWTVPYVLVNIAGAMLAPGLTVRLRPAVVVACGLGIAVAGGAGLAVGAGPATPLPLLIGALAVIGLGQGMAMALVSDLIIAGAPEEQAGSAAATQEVAGELGAALGTAAGGAVGIAVYQATLAGSMPEEVPSSAAETALGSVHDGIGTARSLGADGQELLTAVHTAVAGGLQTYAVAAALLAGLSALLVTWFLVVRDRGAGSLRWAG